ncbi:unnamed protein product [Urochloa humidicola]
MRWIKEVIIPFRSCRKWTAGAVLGTLRKKDHALAPVPLIPVSDDGDVGATSPAPHIVLRMDLHCASCAKKVKRIVMHIPGVEKVATDVGASRVMVTGKADAAVVATSVQVRTRKPVTVVSDGRSVTTARARTQDQHGDQVRARGRPMGAQVRPVTERTAAPQSEEEIGGRQQAQEQATEWTAEVRIAGLDCRRCISRIVQRVARFQGVREIKLTLPDSATTRCRRSTGLCDNPNQHLPGPA